MNVIFMGTPDFAVKSLDALVSAGHNVSYVVCQPDKAKDRGKKVKYPPVKEAALKYGIEVLQPESVKDEEFMKIIEHAEPDIIVVAAYGKILPESILNLPKFGCVNVHASLLPRYRGSAPIQHAIMNGDEKTGVTIMQMARGMDTGDMLARAETIIDHKNCEELHEELSAMGGELLTGTMEHIENGTVVPENQDDSLATMAPMINKKDGLIDFSANADSIERKMRAFYPWPGTYTRLNGEIFKIWKADVDDTDYNSMPGAVCAVNNDGIAVSCGKGTLILKEVQSPGKKRLRSCDWLKGNSIEISTVLG